MTKKIRELAIALVIGVTLVVLGFTTLSLSLVDNNGIFSYGGGDLSAAGGTGPSISFYMEWYPLAILCGAFLAIISAIGIINDMQREKHRSLKSFQDLLHQYYVYQRQRIRRFPPNS